jgi:hypothetical protein
VPRTTRLNARRATVVGLTSFATLALVPLLAPAKPSERALLLLAAVPAAALFGYLAGYAAGSATHLDAAQQDIQLHVAHLQAAQRSASTTAQPDAPVSRLTGEPVPPPVTGSPLGGGQLAGLARPPAEQRGLHLVPAPGRAASTVEGAVAGPDDSSRHLIGTEHPTT